MRGAGRWRLYGPLTCMGALRSDERASTNRTEALYGVGARAARTPCTHAYARHSSTVLHLHVVYSRHSTGGRVHQGDNIIYWGWSLSIFSQDHDPARSAIACDSSRLEPFSRGERPKCVGMALYGGHDRGRQDRSSSATMGACLYRPPPARISVTGCGEIPRRGPIKVRKMATPRVSATISKVGDTGRRLRCR